MGSRLDEASQAQTAVHAVVCRVDTMWCALPVVHIDEVMRPRALAPIVDGPASVAGLALIRGRFVPLIDLAQLLLGRAAPAKRWMSLRVSERHVAVAVGDVVGVTALDTATLQPWPALMQGSRSDAVSAMGARDQQLLTMLSLARVVSTLPVEFTTVQS